MICATKLFLSFVLPGVITSLGSCFTDKKKVCTIKANSVFLILIASVYARVRT